MRYLYYGEFVNALRATPPWRRAEIVSQKRSLLGTCAPPAPESSALRLSDSGPSSGPLLPGRCEGRSRDLPEQGSPGSAAQGRAGAQGGGAARRARVRLQLVCHVVGGFPANGSVSWHFSARGARRTVQRGQAIWPLRSPTLTISTGRATTIRPRILLRRELASLSLRQAYGTRIIHPNFSYRTPPTPRRSRRVGWCSARRSRTPVGTRYFEVMASGSAVLQHYETGAAYAPSGSSRASTRSCSPTSASSAERRHSRNNTDMRETPRRRRASGVRWRAHAPVAREAYVGPPRIGGGGGGGRACAERWTRRGGVARRRPVVDRKPVRRMPRTDDGQQRTAQPGRPMTTADVFRQHPLPEWCSAANAIRVQPPITISLADARSCPP